MLKNYRMQIMEQLQASHLVSKLSGRGGMAVQSRATWLRMLEGNLVEKVEKENRKKAEKAEKEKGKKAEKAEKGKVRKKVRIKVRNTRVWGKTQVVQKLTSL